jgi:hypothetical protein
MKMLNHVKSLLNRNQETSLFGIVRRSIYSRKDLKSAPKFLNDLSIETEGHQIRAEQERARAVVLLIRRISA